MLPPIIILGALLWGCSSEPEPIFSSADSDGPDAKPDTPDVFATRDSIDDDGDFVTDAETVADSDKPDLPDIADSDDSHESEINETSSDAPDSIDAGFLPPDNDNDGYYVCDASDPNQELAVLMNGGQCGDCDDTRDFSYPGAPERIDGRDTNCDGSKEMNLTTDAVAFIGEADGDEAGNNAMAMGDINGGGDDVVIGAKLNNTPTTFDERGAVYAKFGGAGALTLGSKIFLGTDTEVEFSGACAWRLGTNVATIGLDNDGNEEILMGAGGFNSGDCGGIYGDGDGSHTGAIIIAYGRDNWEPAYSFYDIDATNPATLSAKQLSIIKGNPQDMIGDIHFINDIDGNGTKEILTSAGSSQRCNIIPALPYEGIRTVGEIMATEKSYQIFGGGAEDVCNNVASGDVNGDGFADILLGDPVDFKNKAKGKVWLLHGSNNLPAWPAVINLSQLTALSPIDYGTFSGAGNGYEGGDPVELADLNGDGRDEIIIGVGLEDGPFDHSGRIHIIDGDQYTKARQGLHPKVSLKNGDNLVLDSSIFELGGKAIYGDITESIIPSNLDGSGDLNGDGKNDLLIGAGYYTPSNEGATFFMNGAETLSGNNEFPVSVSDEFSFGQSGTGLGHSLIAGGDVNNDGVSDTLLNGVGAPALSKKGATYLLLGGK